MATKGIGIGISIGIVGIGNMGLAMALRLLDRGHAVRVRDIDPGREALARAAGAAVARSAAAAAAGAACVIVAVVDGAQTREVLFGHGAAASRGDRDGGDDGDDGDDRDDSDDGIAAVLPPGTAVMLCPTIAPQDTEACARRLAERGIDCIDAPMSGGPARARDGSMSLMVACADAVFARHAALLADISSRVFRVGTRPGDGARTKLVNNLLAAVNLAGAAEALALASRLGLDATRTLDVIEQSSGQSWIGSDRLRRALAGERAPRAHMRLLAKDSALALRMAASGAGTTASDDGGTARRCQPTSGPTSGPTTQPTSPPPVLATSQAAAALFAQACAQGLADADDGALYNWLRGAEEGLSN